MVWYLIVAAGVILDQLTKLAAQHLKPDGVVTVIPGFLYFIYRVNTGAAWSFLAEHAWGIYALAALSAVASLLFLYLLSRAAETGVKLALSLITAGTIGNMIDRVWRGGVIDFVDTHFGSYQFPTFNAADSLLVVGTVILLILVMAKPHAQLFKPGRAAAAKHPATEGDEQDHA
ncbi:MAG: signal peptidase II [Oscillospiraceae bacterium]|nr:signal peptidase II [Oscillospiraceae bacterium]MDD4368331.1 signal peptidase II [Oscillospiraceae bacterium]